MRELGMEASEHFCIVAILHIVVIVVVVTVTFIVAVIEKARKIYIGIGVGTVDEGGRELAHIHIGISSLFDW